MRSFVHKIVAGEQGSALLLALILLTVLVMVGGAVVLISRGSAMAASQRARSFEAGSAAEAAISTLIENLNVALGSDQLRQDLAGTFMAAPVEAQRHVEERLRQLDIPFESRAGTLCLKGDIKWHADCVHEDDPRIYNATFLLDASGSAKNATATAFLKLSGDVLISIGHLPSSHYEAVVGDGLIADQREYQGPVRVEPGGGIGPGTTFWKDLELGPEHVDGLEDSIRRAGLKTGLGAMDATDSLLQNNLEDLTWDKLRLLLKLETANLPPPPGIFFDENRAIFIEGDVIEMILASQGPDEQMVGMHHSALGDVTLRIRPEFTSVLVDGVPQSTIFGARDRIVVHGRIDSLGGGIVDGMGAVIASPDILEKSISSISMPLTIAASSGMTIRDHILASSEIPLGLLSLQIAGDGEPVRVVKRCVARPPALLPMTDDPSHCHACTLRQPDTAGRHF